MQCRVCGFPRLYVAASLKHQVLEIVAALVNRFSAALCRGLIEALCRMRRTVRGCGGFPRLYVAASLKRLGSGWH